MREKSNSIFFHIGYHRTGTTFIQKYLLPKYKDKVLPFVPASETSFVADCLIEFCKKRKYNPEIYTLDSSEVFSEQCKKKFFKIFNSVEKNIPAVISAEQLSGDIFYDYTSMPDLIYNCFPDSKIIICIRSQFTIIPSTYQYLYIKSGGIHSYEKYVRQILKNNKFDYLTMIEKYKKLFGNDSVKVLIFEELRENKNRFIQEFLSFLGLHNEINDENGSCENMENDSVSETEKYKNKRYSIYASKILRLLNIIYGNSFVRIILKNENIRINLRNFSERLLLYFEKPGAKFIKVSPFEEDKKCKQLILRHYGEKNRELSERFNLQLEKFGYPWK